MALKFRRGTTAQQSGSLAFGEPYVNTTLGTLLIGGQNGDIVLATTGTGSTGNFGAISGSGLDITGNANIGGNLTLGGNITIGNQTSDVVNVVANLSSSLIPAETNVFDLGSNTKIWRDLYISTGSIKFVAGTTVVKELTLATITGLESATGSSNVSITNLNSATASLNTSVSNLNSFSASENTKSSTLATLTGSYDTRHTTIGTYTSSLETRMTAVGTATGSLNTSVSNLNSTTASLNTSVTNLNSFSASENSKASTLATYTASVDTRFTTLGTYTASVDARFTTLGTYTSSLETRMSAVSTSTASLNTSVTNLNTTTASLNTSVSNINTTTASLNTSVSNINSYTSSLKTALSLSGADLTVLGNLTVQGDTTTLNTANLLVEDKLIELAIGTTSSAAANGAGIYISGANASILWDDTASTLDINKSIDIAGNITLTGTVDGVDVSVLNTNINSFSSSQLTQNSALATYTGSANTRFTEIGVVTGSLISSASVDQSRFTTLGTVTASYDGRFTTLATYTGSVEGRFSTLATLTGSNNTRLTNLETTTASLNTSVTNLNSFTSSENTKSSTLGTYTGSVDTRFTTLATLTGSYDTRHTTIGTYTSSLETRMSAVATYTGSNDTTNTTQNTRLTALEASASTALSTNNSQATSITNLNSTTASLNTSVTNINSFTSSENSKASTLATYTGSVETRFGTLGSLSGSFARTNSTNTFNGAQTISGSLTVTQDFVVLGSSSIQNISSSTLNIGTNLITVAVNQPSVRFGGLAIIDSGSAGQSGSLLYDSVEDEFIFVHRAVSGSANITSSHFLMGPETVNNLGNETYLTNNRLPKGTGKEHLNDSQISDDGTTVTIPGALTVTGNITGPIRATNGVVSGSAQISGTGITNNTITIAGTSTALGGTITLATITGNSGIVSGSSQITAGSTTNFATDVKTQLNSNTVVSGSSQVIGILSSLNSYTASNDTTNTSQNTSITNLNSTTASLNTSVSNLNSFSSSENSKASTLATYTASVDTRFTTLGTLTGSYDTRHTTIGTYTSSLETRMTAVGTATGSINTSITNLNLATASLIVDTNNLETFTSSFNTAFGLSGANVTVKGNLTVQGTTTQIDSTVVNIADNIIQLNGTGATNAGLVVRDATAATTTSGSLLWDTTNDKWIAGALGAEDDVVLRTLGQTLTNKTISGASNTLSNIANASLTNSSITIAGTSTALGGTITAAQIGNAIGAFSGSAQVAHDSTTGYSANRHIDHTAVTITAGSGLTGGGDISATRTLSIATGGVTDAMLAGSISNGKLANSAITIAGTSTSLGGTITLATITGNSGIISGSSQLTTDFDSRYLNTGGDSIVSASSQISHDSTTGYSANRHIDHTAVSISAGSGLTGGGDISSTRTLSIATSGVTDAMLAGSISNGKLANSAITIAGTSTSLGGTITLATITGTSGIISGSSQISGLTTSNLSGTAGITNGQLANSSVTVTAGTGMSGGGSVSLGGSVTLTNAGVTSAVAGTGVSVSGATGAVTISIGQSVATSASPTFAGLTINGSITATGDITAYFSSDKRFKDNVQIIPDALSKVRKLNGVTWEWNDLVDDVTKQSPNTGLIAQEVQQVLPEVVKERGDGHLGLDYSKMMGLLVEAIKEQQNKIDNLSIEIENLKKQKGL